MIKFEANGYRFVAPPHATVDTSLFDERVDTARQALARGSSDDARRSYAAAVELYRGEFLDGIEDGGWQWRERERLRAACLEALRWLAAEPQTRCGGETTRARPGCFEIAPFDIDAVRRRAWS